MNCSCLCFINTKALIYINLSLRNTNMITFVEFVRSDYSDCQIFKTVISVFNVSVPTFNGPFTIANVSFFLLM